MVFPTLGSPKIPQLSAMFPFYGGLPIYTRETVRVSAFTPDLSGYGIDCGNPGIRIPGIDTFLISKHGNIMFRCSSQINEAIPPEYRKILEQLFPNEADSDKKPTVEASLKFAEILGIRADYARLLDSDKNTMACFLEHFQNNLDLLIQKTWIEKVDEGKKEKLQDRVPGLINSIEHGSYREALTEFGVVLEELAYLLFGNQSHKEDFTEYTLRIDTQMGLFWWYGGRLGTSLNRCADKATLRALLLIGICYLTNF